jgi:hypothetical protein
MQAECSLINPTWNAHAMCSSGLSTVHAFSMYVSQICAHSYRRVGGSDFAQLLKVCFQKVGIDVFLDVDNLGQGQFDEQLWKRINAAKNVVLVWTKGCE